jgi:diaminohydroxyphosphoribosylaminopyrimidine deaminase/5-amino-6-(5-phosphoribosylamino)uracil reductase
MRVTFDAIMVGANTAITDDPLLLGEGELGHRIKRVIVDSKLRLPLESKLIMTARTSPVIIATTELASASRKNKLRQIEGVEIVETKSKESKVDLKALLKKLAKNDVVNLLVEGGGELAGSFIDQSLVDEVMFFIAPKVIGGSRSSVKGKGVKNINSAVKLENMEIKSLGKDILIKGSVCSRG